MSALAIRAATSSVGFRIPRSTMLMYVGWSLADSASFSWDKRTTSRRSRTADPNCLEILLGTDWIFASCPARRHRLSSKSPTAYECDWLRTEARFLGAACVFHRGGASSNRRDFAAAVCVLRPRSAAKIETPTAFATIGGNALPT